MTKRDGEDRNRRMVSRDAMLDANYQNLTCRLPYYDHGLNIEIFNHIPCGHTDALSFLSLARTYGHRDVRTVGGAPVSFGVLLRMEKLWINMEAILYVYGVPGTVGLVPGLGRSGSPSHRAHVDEKLIFNLPISIQPWSATVVAGAARCHRSGLGAPVLCTTACDRGAELK